MKIETLGGLLKAAEKAEGSFHPTPAIARSTVYLYMGHYVSQATMLSSEIPMDPEDISRAMGSLIYATAIDAKTNLAPEKFKLLEGYPLYEDHEGLVLNRAELAESLQRYWGRTDVFIERMSGGLYGSYMKALSTLKPQARALGHDLSTAATTHLNSL